MNILVITTIYPEPDDGVLAPTTPVVHNFAKEWVKMGHKVMAIHNSNKFPLPFYFIPKKILAYLSGKVGFNIKLIRSQRKDGFHMHDGVKVYRSNILKYIPFGAYSNLQIEIQLNKVRKILKNEKFIPDVIIAHAENPQIYQLYELKKDYPMAQTAVVLHGIHYLDREKFRKWREVYFPSIDKIGFRSKPLQEEAREKIKYNGSSFICPSGIADSFVKNTPNLDTKFSDGNKLKFIFVGQLTPRKHADKVILALNKAFPSKNFELKTVGNGGELSRSQELVKNLHLEEQVEFCGQVAHDKVMSLMRESDCFIMTSEQEVFGLVYFEAMSQGCLAIASKNEGMDGIIENGVNGFLCPSGDADALADVVNQIANMNPSDIRRIILSGYNLARNYSESSVAKKYLENILEKGEAE